MKKFFSLVLALVMALSLTTVAWGATTYTVTDLASLKTALTSAVNGDILDVTATVEIDENIDIDLTGLTVTNNASGHMFSIEAPATEVSITGGTVTIPAGNTASQGFVDVNTAAKLTVNGGTYSGDLDLSGISSYVDRPGFFTNTANGVDLVLNNVIVPETNYCVVWAEAYYNTLTVSGGSFTCDWVGFIAAAEASGDNVKFTNVTATSAKGALIEVVGGGTNNTSAVFTNCTITTTGGNNPSAPSTAIAVSFGASATINGGTYTGSDNASSDGKNAVAIYTTGGSVTVNSGTLNGDVNAITGTGDYEVEITGGTVTGDFKTSGTLADDVDITVSGGTFTTADVSEYVVAGKVFVNGEVQNATPAGNTISYNVKDLTITKPDGTNKDTTGITSVIKVASVTNTSTVNGKTTTTFVPAYYQLAAGSSAGTFVECDKSVADYMFTIKGVGSVFVREMVVPAAFDATPVTLYTAPLKAACGQVGQDNDVYVVIKDKYYATDFAVVPGAENYALLSNGKMVVFYGEATAKDHNWLQATKQTYDTKTGDITSVKCPDCKGVITVYKTPGVFDGKKYIEITEGVADNYFYVAGTAANTVTGTVVGTPSTGNTVQSAQTFDAGIAMYVGMSVMAAAGSAVVIGKKKD